MACANMKCGCRFWCEEKSTECKDVQECEKARIIAMWWSDVKAGRRDHNEENEED